MSSPGSWLFIVNPGAGNGRAGRVWNKLSAKNPWLKNASLICDSPDSLPDALSSALSGYSSQPKLCVVGGDGSVHHVVNQLLKLRLETTPEIGIIPAGSGSDLCRHLKIPADPEKALSHLLKSKPKTAGLIRIQPVSSKDSGKLHSLYAVNICSAGISARVAKRVNTSGTTSRKSYVRSLISELWQREPLECVLKKDDEIIEGHFELLLLAGGTHFGNGIPIMPESSVFSRELKLMTVKTLSTWQMIQALAVLAIKRHDRLSFVNIQSVEEIEIKAPAGAESITLEADGEVYIADGFRIGTEYGLIRLVC